MSTNCSHDECEPYGSCVAATPRDRRQDFWMRWRHNWDTGQLGTDPLAYLDGAMPDE